MESQSNENPEVLRVEAEAMNTPIDIPIPEGDGEVLYFKPDKPPKSRAAKNKSLGYSVERTYALIFQEAGFKFCKTTRNTSRILDACKVDLNFLPVLIQLKAGVQQGLSPTSQLKMMEEELAKNFPASEGIHKKPKAVVHHKPKTEGQVRRSKYDSMVTMTFEDYLTLVIAYEKQLNPNDIQNR